MIRAVCGRLVSFWKRGLTMVALAVLAALGLAASGVSVGLSAHAAAASPPTPTYGTAVVDGSFNEWDTSVDFYAPMYQAGNATKPILANGYLRYDCAKQT